MPTRFRSRTRVAIMMGGLVLALAFPVAHARADEEVIRFAQTLQNLGAISDDQPQLHAFSFVNTSGRNVKLAMTYCHFCTPPILDKEFIKPGESGAVVIELDPTGRRGPIQASATLMEEGRPTTAVTVELKADVCPRVWIEPVNMFPRIVKDVGADARFTVLGRKSDFKVLRVEADPPIAGADISDAKEVPDCGSTARLVEVTVHFPKNAPLGPWGSRMKVITNDTQADPKLITADGMVVGRLGYEPANIAQRLNPAEPFAKTFEIVSDQALGGAIILDELEITARDEAGSLVLDAAPTANPSRVRITLCGTAPLRGRDAVNIRIKATARTLNSGGVETLEIPVLLVVNNNAPR